MKHFYIPLIVLILASSCKNTSSSNNQNTVVVNDSTETQTLPPVETRAANTDYEPAFEGQTRIAGVKTTTPYRVTEITDDLDAPWGIAVLPDNRLLITEKEGDMRIVNPETGDIGDEINGIPDVDDRGQGGLLGITLAPDFESDRMVYWVFSERVSGGNHTAVAKGRLSEDEKSIENATVIYRAKPTYDGDKHYGGRIIFDDDGNLFVSIGERSDKEPRELAQDLSTSFGKIIRITTDGEAVSGNPFENEPNALPEIYSYGHRNPQGLDFHPVTGELWSNEFGPRGGDELNLTKPGLNYGWPVITYGIEYSGREIGNPPVQQKEGMEQPNYYWDPVLSPSGMTFYTGSNIPEWENNLFITGLNSNHIARIVVEGDRIVGEERILDDKNQRFRDIIQGNNGALYTVTDEGKLFKIDRE